MSANCNNLQTTPGITMHELPRNRPAVTRGAAASRPLSCVASTSVSAISQTPWNTHVEADTMFRYSFKILPDTQAQTDTAVSLWVSRAKYQFRLRSSSWPFCSDSPEWRSIADMVTWFGRHGDAFGTTENAFFVHYPQITVSLTSSFSANFNGNRVKNHP